MTQSDAEQVPDVQTPSDVSSSDAPSSGKPPTPPRYLHASSLLFLLIARVRRYLIPCIVAALAASSGSYVFATLLGFGFLLAMTIDVARLFTLRYYIAGGELVVRKGLLSRNQRTIPLSRIQNIDLLQNPLHRLLRVAEVRVETASGNEPEATLRVLSLAAVDQLKHRLQDALPSPGERLPEDMIAPAAEVPAQRTLLAISPRELVTMGLINNRGTVLVAVAIGAFYEFDLGKRLDWEAAEKIARAAWPTNAALAWAVGIVIFLMLLLALRLFSVLWCLLRFYGYRLTADGDDLRVSAGLFTKVSATVPRRRVQFISIHRPLLARLIGRASVRIETAGGAAKSNEDAQATIARRWFVPIIAERNVAVLMNELRAGLDWNEQDFAWRSVHPRAGRRLTRKAVLIALVACPLGMALTPLVASGLGFEVWWPFGAMLGPFVLPLLVWHARRYAASLRYARFKDGIVYRSGLLRKKTSVTFFDKIQVVDVRQTPFDRRWQMARLRIDTAAAGPAEHQVHVALLEERFARDELAEISRLAADCS